MRETMLMLDESEKSTVNMDAPERPGSESRNMKPDTWLKKSYEEYCESFLENHPRNSLCLSGTARFKTNPTETQQQNCATSTPSRVKRSRSEDVGQRSKKNIKKGPSRRVRFNEMVTVHLVRCDSATRAARDGSCWMQLAQNRLRFRRRVEKIGEMINSCLTS